MSREGDHLEREVKLDAWLGFTFPDLDDLGGDRPGGGDGRGVDVGPPETSRLRATYYDTADLRLVRSGITVRHRRGDGTGWTVKFPAGSGPGSPGAVSRTERSFEGRAGKVPAEVASAVLAWCRGAPLVAVARLDTERRARLVSDAEGVVLAEVVDDEVSAYDGDGHLAMRFRELEIEDGPGGGGPVVDAVVARLVAAGARPGEHGSKLARVLGPRAGEPGDLDAPPLGEDPCAGEVLRAGLARSAALIVAHDAGVRAGDDAEAVHQARVGTRRLRSDLQAFGPLLLPAWVAGLREELAWLADALGDVRDADVLGARLGQRIAALDDTDHDVGAALVEHLADQRDDALARLSAVLGDQRYLSLLDRLVDAVHHPAVTAEAGRPAAKVLPKLAAEPWQRLRRAVDGVGDDPSDEDLHRIRIRAKRARYAAELASLSVGRGAKDLAKATARLQDVLGARNDAVVAEAWLRAAAVELPSEASRLAARLADAERSAAAEADRGWEAAWKAVSAKGLRRWMRP